MTDPDGPGLLPAASGTKGPSLTTKRIGLSHCGTGKTQEESSAMAYVKCPNCGFTAFAGWDVGGIATCPECCGKLHLDGGFELSPAVPGGVCQRLSVTRWAPAEARRALSPLLSNLGELAPTVELILSELVTNSVRHAANKLKGAITVEVHELGGRWRIEVEDDGPGFSPAARTAGQDAGSGWGLYLVDRLSDAWGVEREGGRTRVWCDLNPPDHVQPPRRSTGRTRRDALPTEAARQ